MHLVACSINYKTMLGIITYAMRIVENLGVKRGGIKCFMTFMVLDIDGYNLLMGLDRLMKIGM